MINWRLDTTANSAVSSLDLTTLKAHTRIDASAEDSYLTVLINSATRWVENYLGVALVSRQYKLYLDRLPYSRNLALVLPRSNMLSTVSSFDYNDGLTSDVLNQSLTPGTDVIVDVATDEYARVYPAYNTEWPTTSIDVPNSARIIYTAGYTDGANIPDDIKHALYMLVGSWYEQREAVAPISMDEVPYSVKSLLHPHRQRWSTITRRIY